MSRLTITLTAAAASALVAAATVALPALGDDSGGKAGDDGVAALAACLRSHGLDGAPSAPEDLKPWIAQRQAQDPQAVKVAMNACQEYQTGGPDKPSGPDKPKIAEKREPSAADVAKLVACLRDNGVDAPSDPLALKRWLGENQADDAVDRAMVKCKMQLDPGSAAKPGVCGDDGGAKPAEPGVKPDEPATKPDAVPEPTT
jgi:hypothetical protein